MAGPVEVNERLFLTADREKVVPEGDPEAAFLFATPGDEVSEEDAKRYGIKPSKANKVEKAEAGPEKAEKPSKSGSGLTINKES